MALREGTFRLGSRTGRLLLRTSRTGIGARAGHDLTIEATRWDGLVMLHPADPASSTVTVDIDPGSLETLEGTGGIRPLTGADRADIDRTIREILHPERYPITFRSTRVHGSPESVTVDGDLTILGNTHQASVRGTVSQGGRVQGTAAVAQTHWGIKPYSAFLGALKLADEVVVEVDALLEPA